VRRDGSGLREVVGEPPFIPGHSLHWLGAGRAYFEAMPVASSGENKGALYALDAARGVARAIAAVEQASEIVSVSRDGRRALAIRGGWEEATLHLLELSSSVQPDSGQPSPPQTPTASPSSGTTVASSGFGAAQTLTELPIAAADGFEISPDGQWLSYGTVMGQVSGEKRCTGVVVVRQVKAGQAVTMTVGQRVNQHVWLPDSQRMLVMTAGEAGQRGQTALIGMSQGPAQTVTEATEQSHGLGECAISPDGQRVACTVLYDASPAPVPKIGI
jgi:hypothetical protein